MRGRTERDVLSGQAGVQPVGASALSGAPTHPVAARNIISRDLLLKLGIMAREVGCAASTMGSRFSLMARTS